MEILNFFKRQKGLKEKEKSLMTDLCNQIWARKEFGEVVILSKRCLYKKLGEGEVLLIKLKNKKIRLGKLLDFYSPKKKVPGIIVDFGKLEGIEKGKEVIGFEVGYFFVEMEYSNNFDWQEGYRSLKKWEDEFKQRARHKWFKDITLVEFIELSKTRNRAKYF